MFVTLYFHLSIKYNQSFLTQAPETDKIDLNLALHNPGY